MSLRGLNTKVEGDGSADVLPSRPAAVGKPTGSVKGRDKELDIAAMKDAALPSQGQQAQTILDSTAARREFDGDIYLLPDTTETVDFDYLHLIPRSPMFVGVGRGWRHLRLFRFQTSRLDVRLEASKLYKVTLHLKNSVLINRNCEGHHDRRWSEEGSISVVPAGMSWTCSFSGQADFMVAFVAPDIVNEVAASVFNRDQDQIRIVESFAKKDEILERLYRLIIAEAYRDEAGNHLFIDAMTRALTLHLLRAYSIDSPRLPVKTDAFIGWRLKRVIEYMHAHIDENIPLHQLAATSGLSTSHFTRAFRTATGKPPHQYLVGLRIDKARQLLQQTQLSITEICSECGFEQSNHFATMFRKVVGLSPRAYRMAHRV